MKRSRSDEFNEKTKLSASIQWLLTKAYNNRIPPQFAKIFVTSQSGTYSIHPDLIAALTNGHIYCKACANLFPDATSRWNDLPGLFIQLAERGFPVVDVHGAFIRVESLQKTVSFYPEVHLYLMDTLMSARVADLVTIETILKSIRSFSTTFLHAGTSALQARTCEEALHLWLRCACRTALKMASCDHGKQKGERTDDAVQDLASNLSDQQADHYTRQLAFATRLALLANFYAPDLLPFRSLHLGLHLTRNANVHNARRFLDFLSAALATSPLVHMTAEDLVRSARPPTAGPLRINFNAMLAELYEQFEGVNSQFQPSCKVYYTYPVPRPSQPSEKLPEVDFSKSRVIDTSGSLRSFRLDDDKKDDIYREKENKILTPRQSLASPRRRLQDRSFSLSTTSTPASPSHPRRRGSAVTNSAPGHNALEALFSPPATPKRKVSRETSPQHGTFTKTSLEVMRREDSGFNSGTFRLHRDGRRSPITSVFPVDDDEDEAYLTPTEDEPVDSRTTLAQQWEVRKASVSRQRSASTTSLPPVASVSLTTRFNLRKSRRKEKVDDGRTTWAKLQRAPSLDASPVSPRKDIVAASLPPSAEIQAALNRRKKSIERGKVEAFKEAERAHQKRSHAAFTAKVLQTERGRESLAAEHERLSVAVERHLREEKPYEEPLVPNEQPYEEPLVPNEQPYEEPLGPQEKPDGRSQTPTQQEDDIFDTLSTFSAPNRDVDVVDSLSTFSAPAHAPARRELLLEERVRALQAEVESLKEQYVDGRAPSPAPSVQSSPAWTSHLASDLDRLRKDGDYALSLERLNTSLSDLQSEIVRLSLQQEKINKTLQSPPTALSKALTSSATSISGSSQSGRATWSQRTPVTEILPAPVTQAEPLPSRAASSPFIAPMPYFMAVPTAFSAPPWAGSPWTIDPVTGLPAAAPMDSPPGKPLSPDRLLPQREEEEMEDEPEEEPEVEESEEEELEEETKEEEEVEDVPVVEEAEPQVALPPQPKGLFFVELGEEERTEAEGAAANEQPRADGGLAATTFVIDAATDDEDAQQRRKEKFLAASARRRQQAAKKDGVDSETARRRAAERVREAKKMEDKIRRETIYQAYLERKNGLETEDGPAAAYTPTTRAVGIRGGGSRVRGPRAGVRGRGGLVKPNRAVSEERLNSDGRLTYQHRSQSSSAVSSNGTESPAPSLKLYVQPRVKSNRSVIVNALSHCCLAGTVNQSMLELVLSELQVAEGSHFMILFRDSGCQYRSFYKFDMDSEECQRMSGVGPKKIKHAMVHSFYKYNSGAKKFTEITSTNHLSPVVDAFTVFNKYWKKCPTCGGGVKNARANSQTRT